MRVTRAAADTTRKLTRALRRGLRRPAAPGWTTTVPLTERDRGRLLEAGVPAEIIADSPLRRVEGPAVAAWRARHNELYVSAAASLDDATLTMITDGDATEALVCLDSVVSDAAYVFVRGGGPILFIGPECRLPHAEVHCGAGSRLILEGFATSTWHATLDARNGGVIRAGYDQLWASDIIVSTDDMHRIEDFATGARINPYGGRIEFGRHVWLAREVMVFGGTTVGGGSILGARTLVRNRAFPASAIIAGTPGRVIREGATWGRDDLP